MNRAAIAAVTDVARTAFVASRIRRGVPAGPPYASLHLDGVTQIGTAVLSTPLSGPGYAMVAQCTVPADQGGLMCLRAYTIGDIMWMECQGAAGRIRAHYEAPTIQPGAAMGAPVADSNGFALQAETAVQNGGSVDVTQRNEGLSGPGSLQSTASGAATLSTTLNRIDVGAYGYGAGYLQPMATSVCRVAVWADGGLSAADMTALKGDGTLATDWQTALSGRPPLYEYLMWLGVEVGSTFVVPETNGGPDLVFAATAASDLDFVTIPTGHA